MNINLDTAAGTMQTPPTDRVLDVFWNDKTSEYTFAGNPEVSAPSARSTGEVAGMVE